jgi:hypothetical protein
VGEALDQSQQCAERAIRVAARDRAFGPTLAPSASRTDARRARRTQGGGHQAWRCRRTRSTVDCFCAWTSRPAVQAGGKTYASIAPEARSSMWEDPDAGRTTEIDFIQGEIVRLASKTKRAAPLNERIIELIKNRRASYAGLPEDRARSCSRAIIKRENCLRVVSP